MTESPGKNKPHPRPLDDRQIGLLRCPACKGALSIKNVPPQQLISCLQCLRSYPVADGLPILIAERATLETVTHDPSRTGDTASHGE